MDVMTSHSFLAKLFSSRHGMVDQRQPDSSDAAVPAASTGTSHKNIYGLQVLKEAKAREGELIVEYIKLSWLQGDRL